MEMQDTDTQRALRLRIAQLRADLTALEDRLAGAADARIRFREACEPAAPPAPAAEGAPAAGAAPAQDTPLAIAAG